MLMKGKLARQKNIEISLSYLPCFFVILPNTAKYATKLDKKD